jgi:serine/threonine protein kinase
MRVDNEGVTDYATGERNQMILPQDVHYLEEIGSGNGGVVKKAIHKSTGMPLAIKIINVYDKGKRHQLYNELKTIKQIESPYLLKCYGAFFEEGSVRLVLEYMDCGSMETMIQVINQLVQKNP